jgi:hypothetical protein
MAKVRKFWNLPRDQKWLVLGALPVVAIARLLLWVLPFRFIRGRIMNQAAPGKSSPVDAAPEEIARAVARASSVIPCATCLTQAVALQWLLQRRGIGVSVRLGAARDEQGAFKAHAWVEYAGRVLIGGNTTEFDHFVPLRAMGSPAGTGGVAVH